ncbi:MAG: flagellar biosynthesis protein FlhB [Phycisphaeraceae bacterium]
MADTSGDKTEDATPKQLRKAREKGQVARSAEMTAAAVLIAGVGMFVSQAGVIADAFQAIFRTTIATAVREDLTPLMMIDTLGTMAGLGFAAITPVIVIMAAAGLFIAFIQVGALLTFEPLKPKLEKLNIFAGMKRLFFSMNTYIELLKGILKITVIGLLCWNVIRSELEVLLQLGKLDLVTASGQTLRIVMRCVWQILLFFVAVAVLDFLYQKWKHAKDHRMTKQQVKDEYKEQEGDPHNKAQRERMHREISQQVMVAQTEKADVIVTNPEHLACALRYDPENEGAPRLVAKGEGHVAQQIKQIGKEKGIPVLRDVSLARALYELNVDTQIPEELYDAVAEVLKWVEMVAASEGREVPWLKEGAQGESAEVKQ